jgi:hypothetical protein
MMNGNKASGITIGDKTNYSMSNISSSDKKVESCLALSLTSPINDTTIQ